ncbi:MAG: hypothetical protein FWC36_07945 [Spirochaetes bacterium]|nr:hypothetical protein [Spirochaetota bacterium]
MMIKLKIVFLLIFLVLPLTSVFAHRILYAEEFYRLYHRQLHHYKEDHLENIFWLEQALRADFANPLNALAVIRTPQEWERYRNLFRMHVSLKLVESYLGLGSRFDRMQANFFNAPFRDINIRSLERAREIYEFARIYWEEALRWSAKVPRSWIVLEEVQHWEDQAHRIREGLLNYNTVINRHIARIDRLIEEFRNMDDHTFCIPPPLRE